MLSLPTENGKLIAWSRSGIEPITPRPGGFQSRVAYAATHVVPHPSRGPGSNIPPIDWDATLSIRRHIWGLGLGVAEAMDTAQRGSGVGWATARELIRRTAAESGGPAVYGAATDQLAPNGRFTLAEITRAYREQVDFIVGLGGRPIVMASRHLAATASSIEDYITVYDDVISEAGTPVFIHWLGEMFDSKLGGYWGAVESRDAAENVLSLIASHRGAISGLKLSLLDPSLEVELRRRLPEGVAMLTGDDLNYVDLIYGDGHRHSDALLGIFGPIAPAAAAALQALDRGDSARYRALLEPTLPLARHMFAQPTHRYKTGVAFLAYLNGLQDHFRMVAGAEGDRSLPHLAQILVLADRAGVITEPDLAERRMKAILESGSVDT